MAKYLFAYRGGDMPEGEAAQAAVMAAWGAWFETIGAGVLDPGDPCAKARTVSADGAVGPESPASLSGYTVIEADNLDAAVAFARTCPVLAGGSSIEVIETFPAM
jgi:hypothetical protein